MNIDDVKIIGVGKDEYSNHLSGMVEEKILPWVADSADNSYPVWENFGATQRSTYFLNRTGELFYETNITSIDPENPTDYEIFINLILNFRSIDGPSFLRVPEDFSLIQGAINEANDGDFILISPGVYSENISLLDKNLTIASLIYTGFDGELIGETILDGEGDGSVITIAGGQDQSTLLVGLTIQNGSSNEAGGGILIEDSSPVLSRNTIRNNHSGDCGGRGAGIAILENSYPHIFSNTIHSNTVSGSCDCECYFGGGIYVDESSWPIIGGSIILSNKLYDNHSDIGYQLYRDHNDIDTTNWVPIYAHYNSFENCPPDFPTDVYPVNGWDLGNCQAYLSFYNENNEITPLTVLPSYPNPFNSRTTIEIMSKKIGTFNIKVYNLLGENVDSYSKIKLKQGVNQFNWEPNQQVSGIYFFQIELNNAIYKQKVLFIK